MIHYYYIKSNITFILPEINHLPPILYKIPHKLMIPIKIRYFVESEFAFLKISDFMPYLVGFFK